MFCGLEEERTRLRKEKKLIAAKSGLVGIKGYIETYNRVKYLLSYLSRFSDLSRFSGSKSKVT